MKTTIILILVIITNIYSETGIGYGSSKSEALYNAKLDVLEKTVGLDILSSSYIKNNTELNNSILTHAAGVITSYKIVSEEDSNGTFTIKIDALTEKVSSELLNNYQFISFLLDELGFPEFYIDTDNSLVKNYFTKELLKYGFKVSETIANYSLKIEYHKNVSRLKNSYNVKSIKKVKAGVLISLVKNNSNQVISSRSISAEANHKDENVAEKEALNKLTPFIIKQLLTDAISYLSKEKLTGIDTFKISIERNQHSVDLIYNVLKKHLSFGEKFKYNNSLENNDIFLIKTYKSNKEIVDLLITDLNIYNPEILSNDGYNIKIKIEN